MDFTLSMEYAPGDNWALTGLLLDISEQYPDFRLGLQTGYPEIFRGNPFYHQPKPGVPVVPFRFGQEGSRYSYGNRSPKDSMAEAFYRFINREAGLAVERRFKAVDYYLTGTEQRFSMVPLDRPVCIVNAGYKCDNPAKHWGFDKFQSVVDALADRVRFVQVGAVRKGTDFNRHLTGVEHDLRGQTSLRELAQLVYHADFVLTGVSQLHHIAAIPAYKPRHCITVAGSREPENWANCYTRQGVEWHWLGNNCDFRDCAEQNPEFHEEPGCWISDCGETPPPCMRDIPAERVIEVFKEVLK